MSTKIVITGTFSAGKTTLLHLFDGSNQIQIIPEVARKILELNPEFFSKPELQKLILQEQIDREREANQKQATLIVCDRGLMDVIVYSRYFGHPEPSIMYNYDHIFVCSPEGVPCAYGAEAEQMRQKLHGILLDVLNENKLKFILLEGSPRTRYSIIQREIAFFQGIEGNVRPMQERK